MEEVYIFKVALKFQKRLWRRIEIKGNQTFSSFDQIIRSAFNHDTFDHLSEFYLGVAWRSEGLGEIDPFGGGSGSKTRINLPGLIEGNKIEYVYDFGDNIQHVITLEKIVEPEKNVKYPRISSQNKPKYQYCEMCEAKGMKTIATWICIECSEKIEKAVFMCEECIVKEHEYHATEELLY